MNKTTENLMKAIQSKSKVSKVNLVYKLVYDPDSGKILDTTVEDIDHNNWIEITLEQNNQQRHLNPTYSIVDGKIYQSKKTNVNQETPNRKSLYTNSQGNIATDSYNMLLINSTGSKRWTYD